MSRQGPLARRKSINEIRPRAPTLTPSGKTKKRDQPPEPLLHRRRRSFQHSFNGVLRNTVPDMPISKFTMLMEASGGVIQTKVPGYSQLLRACSKVPAMQPPGEGPLEGRRGAGKLVSELHRFDINDRDKVTGTQATAEGRTASDEVVHRRADAPVYTNPMRANDHMLGGCIKPEQMKHYTGSPTRVSPPKVSPPLVSPVALQRAHHKLLSKEALQKVGGIIARRQQEIRSASADSAAAWHHHSPGPAEDRVDMELSPLPYCTTGAGPPPAQSPFRPSFKHSKQSLRMGSGLLNVSLARTLDSRINFTH